MQSRKRNLLDQLAARLERHGAANMAYECALKCANLAVELKVLRGVVVESPDPAFLNCPREYRATMLTAQSVREFARDPVNEMSQKFTEEALSRGDQCYAILDGGTLAAYGWYAYGATPIGLPDMLLRFHREYVYMYKGFTNARYRGQRLHATGMTMALRHFRSEGYRGLVSYVESVNFDSLKSCARMGYSVFGSVYLVKLFGCFFAFSSPGCEAYEFRITRVAGSGSAGLLFGK